MTLKDAARHSTESKENIYVNEELRLPSLTGTKEQCVEAMNIRTELLQKAEDQYEADSFKMFIELITYESHSLFWISSKDCDISRLINKIAFKNPIAFDLTDMMQ